MDFHALSVHSLIFVLIMFATEDFMKAILLDGRHPTASYNSAVLVSISVQYYLLGKWRLPKTLRYENDEQILHNRLSYLLGGVRGTRNRTECFNSIYCGHPNNLVELFYQSGVGKRGIQVNSMCCVCVCDIILFLYFFYL